MKTLESAVKNTLSSVIRDVSVLDDEKTKKANLLRLNLGKVVSIPIKEIELDENIRKTINRSSDAFQRLVESIKEFGVLENAVVEFRETEKGYRLVCIAGHRRILAALQIGTIVKISCLILKEDGEQRRIGSALSENLNREDLHCLDIGESYQKLLNSGWREEQLAKNFCRDIRTIRHYVKAAEWPEDIKNLVRSHSEIFSTRILMREFAYRKFDSWEELRFSIQAKINQRLCRDAPSSKKEKFRLRLDDYFDKHPNLSKETRKYIVEIFSHFRLL